MPHQPTPLDPRVLYITSRLSLRQVAKELAHQDGCSLRTLARRSKAEGWEQQRQNLESGGMVATAGPDGAPSPTVVGGNTGPARVATDGNGGTTTSPTPHDLAAAAAIEQIAAEQKATRDRILSSIRDSYETAVQGVALALAEATNWLAAHRSRPVVEPGADGGDEVVLETPGKSKKINFQTRARAMSMLSGAASTLRLLQGMDPTQRTEAQALELDRLRGEVEFVKARVAGTLPAEKLEISGPSGKALDDLYLKAFGTLRHSVASRPPQPLPRPTLDASN